MQFNSSSDSGVDTKNFVKLKDKESAIGVFRGDPYDFRQHWVDKRSVLCTGAEKGCKLCAEKVKDGFRFRLNFITKENGGYVPKIFEQGWMVYEQLRALHEGDYKLDKTIVRITRSGTGQNTSYTVIPVPKGDVTPEIEKTLAAIKLHDLKNLEKKDSQVSDAGAFGQDVPPPGDMDDIPF